MHTRPYTDDDRAAVTSLVIRTQKAGRSDRWPTPAELTELLESSTLDRGIDTRAWTSDERLLAVALLLNHAFMLFFVDEAALELSEQVMGWFLERQAVGESLYCQTREDDSDHVALLTCHGFMPQDEWVLRMTRDLTRPLPDAALPPGYCLREMTEDGVEPYVELHRAAFGTENMTLERRFEVMRGQGYRPDLNLAVIDPDGAWVAYCVGSVDAEANRELGVREGWVDIVGSRPDRRGRGLARAATLEVLRRMRDEGLDTALLGTGSWNERAQRLFESLGFGTAYRVLTYERTA